MHPWEVFNNLKLGESLKEQHNVPEDFWKGVRLALDPQVKLPYRFVLRDPSSYGPGAPWAIFERIYWGIVGGSLTEDQAAIAISRFSQACTRDQWTLFYRPLIERNIPLTYEDFQLLAPVELRFPILRHYEPRRVEKECDLPQSYFIEPFYEGKRVLFFVKKNSIEAFHHDGVPFELGVFEEDFLAIQSHKLFKGGIVLDAVLEDQNTVILNDVLTIEQFKNQGKTQTFEKRRTILESFYYSLVEQNTETIELAEAYRVNGYNEALIQFNMLIEQGFGAFIGRDAESTYWDHRDILVAPEGRKLLKLSALNSGPVNSRFENLIWSLEGSNEVVILGLTMMQRKEIWENQSSYAGKKFYIAHCGTFDNGRMMFGQFLEWSN